MRSGGGREDPATTQTQKGRRQGRPFPARPAVRQGLRCQIPGRHLRRQDRRRSAAPAHRARPPAIHFRRIRREQHAARPTQSAAAGPRHLRRLAHGGRLQQQQRQGHRPGRDPAEHRRRFQDHRHGTHPRFLHAAAEEQCIHALRVRRRRRQREVQRGVRPQPADAVLRGRPRLALFRLLRQGSQLRPALHGRPLPAVPAERHLGQRRDPRRRRKSSREELGEAGPAQLRHHVLRRLRQRRQRQHHRQRTDNNANIYGVTAFIDAFGGYIEAGYGLIQGREDATAN